MTETVVHVTTLEQWKSVLDIWFKQGFRWYASEDGYVEGRFNLGSRLLGLNVYGGWDISYWSENDYDGDNLIEYSEFMAQQKEDKEVKTYYVTQEQLDLIKDLRTKTYPIYVLINFESDKYSAINNGLDSEEEKALLRYLGGDETIEFKVKESLYRLWRIDDDGDTVYMTFAHGTPDWTATPGLAFTAPLEEIKKWQTPAWEIEKVVD